jgi:dihydrofolate reductase/thymidylate synthase
MARKTFNIILARSSTGVIGRMTDISPINAAVSANSSLPWNLPQEMAYFRHMTTYHDRPFGKQNVVIMGRNTYETINRPLPNRTNVVISKSITEIPGVIVYDNFEKALHDQLQNQNNGSVWVIGGKQLYEQAINHPLLGYVYITEIHAPFESANSIKFEWTPNKYDYTLISKDECEEVNEATDLTEMTSPTAHMVKYDRIVYKNIIYANEYQYLDALAKVVEGERRYGRNGFTNSVFGVKMEFNIQRHFPLLTTKKTFMRGIFEELKWILAGSTDVRELNSRGITFWDKNVTNEFFNLQKQNGLLTIDLPEKCLGAGYGFQMRNCGAEYVPFCKPDEIDPSTKVDQLYVTIDNLVKKPFDRRHVISLWHAKDLTKMALPPCHGVKIQFYVSDHEDGYYLSCEQDQRSGDMFLGVPFNIASYTLLVHMMCHYINTQKHPTKPFKPDRLILNVTDAHMYEQHIDACKQQLERLPFYPPTLTVNEGVNRSKIEDYEWSDFTVNKYQSHPTISAVMIE